MFHYTPMPRPLAFNRDDALDAALRLFWQRGYHNTSMQDLLDTMGLSRSSFYASFGDKHSLYLEVLELFAQRTRKILDELRNTHSPEEAIRGFFEATLFCVPERRMRLGCLLVNTALETAHTDETLRRRANAGLDAMQAAFEDCFRRAVDSGQIDSAQDPACLARFVMTLNQGLRVASRRKTSRDELSEILETGLALLPFAA